MHRPRALALDHLRGEGEMDMAGFLKRIAGSLRCACLVVPIAMAFIVLSPGTGSARTWHVPGDAPTIQAGIDLAQPGDDVLVAPGTYAESGITMKGGVPVRSEQGPGSTIVDSNNANVAFLCDSLQLSTAIEGFSITRGNSLMAGGINCTNSTLLVRNCWIDHCQSWMGGAGLYAFGGSVVSLEDSRFSESHGGQHVKGAIYCDSQSRVVAENCVIMSNWTAVFGGIMAIGGSDLELLDCQVTDNHPNGVLIADSSIRMERCLVTQNGDLSALTFYGNAHFTLEDCVVWQNSAEWVIQADGTGSIVGCDLVANDIYTSVLYMDETALTHLSMERTIIAFNNAPILSCPFPPEKLSFRCCDAYGNQSDEICGEDLGGNFSDDPLFCDAPNGDYSLDANSPCLPGNHPDGVDCGLIGARGLGCGGTPTKPTTWGRIKVGYR